MSRVLEFAGGYVEGLTPSGGANYLGYCPFHGEKAGSSKSKSFSFNTATGQWFCFARCGGGGFRSFLKQVGKSREQSDLIFSTVGKYLQPVERKVSPINKGGLFLTKNPLPERILGLFEWCPESLVDAGFDEDLLWEHDVGFDKNYDRITYAVRDIQGTLAGIVGRNTSPWMGGGKYKVYKKEIQEAGYDGVPRDYSFDNHDYVWRWDKIYARLIATEDETPTIYITEGFKACLWMVQHGYVNTVALMGVSLSQVQRLFLERIGARVIMCLDNNYAGQAGTVKIGYSLRGSDVLVMPYPSEEVQQPDDLSPPQLHDATSRALSLTSWRQKNGISRPRPSGISSWRTEQQKEDGMEGRLSRPRRHSKG